MAFELKEGQGTLFKNARKEEGSKQPDYRGELMMDGTLLEVAGWLKDGAKGKWMSLSVKPKEAQAAAPAPTPKRGSATERDEIPFAPYLGSE